MFASLFEKYDRLVLFDTETTGLQYSRDEIIEFAAVVVEPVGGAVTAWQKVLHALQAPFKAVCRRKQGPEG